jgi:hypothetical protein
VSCVSVQKQTGRHAGLWPALFSTFPHHTSWSGVLEDFQAGTAMVARLA